MNSNYNLNDLSSLNEDVTTYATLSPSSNIKYEYKLKFYIQMQYVAWSI